MRRRVGLSIQEWWGWLLSDNIKGLTDRFALAGFRCRWGA